MTDEERNNLITFRLERANQTLNEAITMIEGEYWNGAVNRLYYACFYAVTALLVKEKIAANTHGGTRQMFGFHFIQTQKIKIEHGKTYSKLFEKRQTGDYDDFIIHTKETLVEFMPLAKALIADIEKYLNE